jgi:AcrR family transcriptional regulator
MSASQRSPRARSAPALPARVTLGQDRPERHRDHVRDVQRMRILDAMVRVAGEYGLERTSVARVVVGARVSRRTFYALFRDRDDCLLAAIEQTVTAAQSRASAAHANHHRWVNSVRAGLHALLLFFDEQPGLAHLCVVQAPAGSAATLARRREVLDQLAQIVDRGRSEARAAQPPAITAQGIVGGALSVIHTRLLSADRQPLTELLNSLMSTIVLPYLGTAAARRELSRPLPAPAAGPPLENDESTSRLELPAMRLTYRTLRVLAAIAREPGLGNNQIGERAGIRDQGQISKLLARLATLGLIENTGKGQPAGAAKAWRLTPHGQQLERTFRREAGLT